MGSYTLCWDCKKAIGGCRWSNSLKPVKGWDAVELKATATRPYGSYFVKDCPEFERDAYNGGTSRKLKEIKL